LIKKYSELCELCTTIVESFRRVRKFYRRFLPFSNKRLGLFSRQDAKNAKFGKYFFLCGLCAFARDIPIFWLRLLDFDIRISNFALASAVHQHH